MLDGILKKIFGDKNQKDLNELLPIVDLTNKAHEKLQSISDDELRNKTKEFKEIIIDSCISFRNEIKDLKNNANSDLLNISEKEAIY